MAPPFGRGRGVGDPGLRRRRVREPTDHELLGRAWDEARLIKLAMQVIEPLLPLIVRLAGLMSGLLAGRSTRSYRGSRRW